MAEYIEREAFLAEQRHLYCENCARRKNGKGKFVYDIGDAPCRACDIMDVLDAVEDFPAADVRPVKRGKWVKNIRGDYCLVCSECGYGFPTDGFAWLDCNRRNDERETACHINDIMDFCPNCGADMRPEPPKEK